MADEPAPARSKRNPTVITLVIVAAVALVEGVAFVAVIKFFGGGPSVAYGVDDNHVMDGGGAELAENLAEVVLLETFKVPNSKTGHTIVYDFDISIAVPVPRKAEMEQIAQSRGAELRDRVAQIIRQARPDVLQEDDFGTLRMLIKRTLNEIVGDEQMIQRVLIPRCMPIPTGG